jgi:rhomboid protease GluP
MTDPDKNAEFEEILRGLEREARDRPARPTPETRVVAPEPPEIPRTPPPASQRVAVGLPLGARVPWASRVLLALNLGIFVLPWVLSGVTGQPLDQLVLALGAKENRQIYEFGEYYRFLTAMFLHGGITHIAFNTFALYSLGFETERIYGSPRFLTTYLLAGLGGGVASYALNPSPSVGASGAIFGLIGALAAFYYLARGVLGQMARQQLGSLIFTLLINLGLGFTVPLIDNNAHIGGLVVGAVVGWLLAPRFRLELLTYPPRAVREYFGPGWLGAFTVLVLLASAVMVIVPPLP